MVTDHEADRGRPSDEERSSDETPPTDETRPVDNPVVLFDGVCNLCNGVVGFLLPRDPNGRLRFAPLQSAAGKALLADHGLPIEELETIVLVEGDSAHTKSDAAIRIAELLGWPYRLLRIGRVVPRPIRDRLYEFIADNRYDWFGRKEQCMIPDEDVSDRFLD
ncbi:thiol-disulfide oxidoreductase DCC family protein [Halobellus captivus]|uniref:thiol-disulfide oxidoreductase DCC family protein n=1 Tax=Halobellus captivus TaxID=2592614 RepID=UPI0011A03DA3|nr:thiol-disulfide oxidoreductase DCC family protein [Halobellus captivus]